MRDYALRLHGANKHVMLLVEPKAGHSPKDNLASEAYLYMIEKALADHLVGGRIESQISKQLSRYLKRSIVIDSNDFTPGKQ